MPENLRGFIVMFLIVGIFFFALVNFSIQFAEDNNANQSLINNDSRWSNVYTQINANISGSESVTKNNLQAMSNESSTEGEDNQKLLSFVPRMLQSFKLSMNIVKSLFKIPVLLGVSPVIIGVLLLIISIYLITLMWRALRSGD